jgi:ADP-ribosylglycohydrolase
MYGAIVGDIIGSVYERKNTDNYNFPLYNFITRNHSKFTDDTVLTIATASAILKALHNKENFTSDLFANEYKEFYARFPNRGYGRGFRAWAEESQNTIGGSFGNGSAMRVSPVAWVVNDLDKVLNLAAITAECSHSHEEGIKGAKAIASCIFLARKGCSKKEIQNFVSHTFDYDLNANVQDLIPFSSFAACQATVPPAIRAFLESNSYEDAIRRAVIMGGDSDTIAAMTGSIAEAFYNGVPSSLRSVAFLILPLSMKKITTKFRSIYKIP